jgi:hypothetical protein
MMDIVIGLLIVAGVAYLAWKHWPKPASADMTDPAGASAAAKVAEEIKQAADVNKDGKVNVADAVEAVKKTAKKATSKKTAKKAPAKKVVKKSK